MRFTKMHGAGNDFIVMERAELENSPLGTADTVRALCARRFGVGADGLIAVGEPRRGGDVAMEFFNSDGSSGEMCGNGARCLTRYCLESGRERDGKVRIETASGVVVGWREPDGAYSLRLADVTALRDEGVITVCGEELEVVYVELGEPALPHAVTELPQWREIPRERLFALGRALRNYEGFPKGANVTFCRVAGEDVLDAVTFERGVEDFTLACGTGCAAATAAMTARGRVSGRGVRVRFPGGELRASLRVREGGAGDIVLTGPAVTVFRGEADGGAQSNYFVGII